MSKTQLINKTTGKIGAMSRQGYGSDEADQEAATTALLLLERCSPVILVCVIASLTRILVKDMQEFGDPKSAEEILGDVVECIKEEGRK